MASLPRAETPAGTALRAGGRLRPSGRRRPSSAPPDDDVAVAADRRRGRGAQSNASGRYEPLARIAFDDGWQNFEELPPFKTTVTIDSTRKIITRNDSPDISFDRSINPYRGCEHGCIYCFARPTHAYLGLSPGSTSRPSCSPSRTRPSCSSASCRAAATCRAPSRSAPTPIPISRSSASYQVMRRILEVLERCGHPVGIVTKSALVCAISIFLRAWRAQPGQGGGLGDHARPQARPRDGAAGGDAGAAARRVAAAVARPACRRRSWSRR